jgi:hypothetical protein
MAHHPFLKGELLMADWVSTYYTLRYRWKAIVVALLLGVVSLVVLVGDSAQAFRQNTNSSGRGENWSNNQATLNLRLGCADNGTCWNAIAREAAEEWNRAGSHFRFRFLEPSRSVRQSCTDPDFISTLLWSRTDCGRTLAGVAIAVTVNWTSANGRVVDSDVVFNTYYRWGRYDGPLRPDPSMPSEWLFDLRRTAIHELGHVLGLGHPNDYGQRVTAIMNAGAYDIDALQPDDRAGVQAIYGSSAPRRGQPGHADYCRDYGPCQAGEGDCEPGQCATGLMCANDVGARYGLPAHYDVCEARTGPDPDYCVGRTCEAGEGDCDPGQCGTGLVCVNDVGANYGLPAHYDVCEDPNTSPPCQ